VSYFALPATILGELDQTDGIVTVDKGNASGVRVGMQVVARDGVVGLVLRVASDQSEVALIESPEFEVPVVVNRLGPDGRAPIGQATGTLRGTGIGNLLELEIDSAHETTDIGQGDEVIAARDALDLAQPKIPIGSVVTDVSPVAIGSRSRYTVAPHVKVSDLHTVQILIRP
jgi:cell shape-determining protein MreC